MHDKSTHDKKTENVTTIGKATTTVKHSPVIHSSVKRDAKGIKVYQPPCHTGNVFCFTVEIEGVKISFYGGGSMRSADPKPGWILLDLADHWRNNEFLSATGSFKGERIAKWGQRYIRIDLFIRDGGAPYLPAAFYWDLLKDITDYAKSQDAVEINVLAACQGGHGRTGTILATIAGLTGVSTGDPVEWLRGIYCKKAVETEEQIEYIANTTGLEVKAEPSYQTGGSFVYKDGDWVQFGAKKKALLERLVTSLARGMRKSKDGITTFLRWE